MLTRRGFVIEKNEYPTDELVRIRKELTVSIPSGIPGLPDNNSQASFSIYLESPNKMCLPRYYAQDRKGFSCSINRMHDKVVSCPLLEFVGSINPEKQQDKAVAHALEAFKNVGGGTLSLPTGYGKTVVAINIACQMKVKTMIVVHKEFLLSQWEERIRQFAPSARVGFLRQNKTDTDNKDIVIAMLQSVISKNYCPDMMAQFGLVIFDEVHHLSAPTFSQCLFSLCAPYILGLSATPQRKDGLDWVLESFIGPVFFMVKRKQESHVHVERKNFDLDLPDGDLPRLQANKRFYDSVRIITLLSDHSDRNNFIVETVNTALEASAGKKLRKILVLAERREHCKSLCDMLTSKVSRAGYTASVYMGGMKKDKLKESETSNVIFATYSFANEGLDIGGLDTLVYATPKSDVVQSAGRILRDGGKKKSDAGNEEENPPLIIDIVDSHVYFERKYKSRCTFYKKSGFHILKNNAKDTEDREPFTVKDQVCTELSFIDDD